MSAAAPRTHYDVLGVSPSAPLAELRAAWRRQLLLWHPDKARSTASNEEDVDIVHRLTEAWECLRDAEAREVYNRELARVARGGAPLGQVPVHTETSTGLVPRTTISLEDFDPHYASAADLSGEEEEGDTEPTHYTHPCRCGGVFLVRTEDLERGVDVVGCEGCGDWVGVGYNVVEDNDEEDEREEVEEEEI